MCACAAANAADYQLPAPPKEEFIYFTADEVVYDQTNGTAALKGSGEVFINDNESRKVIKADDIQIYTREKILISNGTTVIEDENGSVTMQDIHFDLASRRLIIKQIAADYHPVRVLRADSVETKDGAYILRRAVLTCCDLEKPHYTVYVGKANLKPNERIYATNAVLRIGKVPVLYLPFIYRSLNDDRIFTTYIDFSQSNNTGVGILTSTVYTNGKFRATGNLDYYTRSGIGYGTEVAYDDPGKFRGSLQAYTIRDNHRDDKQRWGINGGYWWQVHDSSDSLNNDKGGAIYYSQLETREVSDPDFNNDFFRSNPFVVAPDKITRAAIVRQSRLATLRAGYTNRRTLDDNRETYSNAEENLPRLDLIFNPFTVKQLGGIVNNVAFSLNNSRLGDYDFVQYMEGRWAVSRDLKPHRNFTLTPTAWYNQQIILKDPTNNDDDKFVSRYGGQLNLRSELITGLLDVGYRYEKRSVLGSLTTGTDAFDNGEESNLIYIQNYYIPIPDFYFKASSGYNLRNSTESWDIENRVEPFVGEVGYFSPYTGTNIFLQNIYDIDSGNQAFVFNGTFKGVGESLANFGVANYNTDRSTFLITTKFMLAPKNSSWWADVGLDFSAGDSWHAYSKHIIVNKRFHDFTLMLGVRDRSQNLSFSARVNVICGKSGRTEASQRIDNFWYPWRAEGLVRDNF